MLDEAVDDEDCSGDELVSMALKRPETARAAKRRLSRTPEESDENNGSSGVKVAHFECKGLLSLSR